MVVAAAAATFIVTVMAVCWSEVRFVRKSTLHICM